MIVRRFLAATAAAVVLSGGIAIAQGEGKAPAATPNSGQTTQQGSPGGGTQELTPFDFPFGMLQWPSGLADLNPQAILQDLEKAIQAMNQSLGSGDWTEVAVRPRLGVSVVSLSSYPASLRTEYKLPDKGVMVAAVAAGTPAFEAGLSAGSKTVDLRGFEVPVDGDVILKVDGKAVANGLQLLTALDAASGKDSIVLTVERDGKEKEVSVKLKPVAPNPSAERPSKHG